MKKIFIYVDYINIKVVEECNKETYVTRYITRAETKEEALKIAYELRNFARDAFCAKAEVINFSSVTK